VVAQEGSRMTEGGGFLTSDDGVAAETSEEVTRCRGWCGTSFVESSCSSALIEEGMR
jgi:hypothetical protein